MTAPDTTFEFSPELRAAADRIVARYPAGRQASAALPVLDLVQRHGGGWLTTGMMDAVADYLGMAPIRIYEVASFYTMFNLAPVGRAVVEVCTTTPCWLRGSDDVVAACREVLGIDLGETSADGQFTLREVECLGACVNAPILKIGDDYYEDLDGHRTRQLLEAIKRGERPAAGSQTGRQGSAPDGGPTTLRELEEGR
jgi:NADH-quinone oxidoreductase E subunit